ncbi:thiamine pyrophosphate-binding protein [Acrocarpospora macrocephala]|uniref:Acetolactate synthase n=1 Tax=Acrocarpospora macrocephala TaxID=150177 RepID=A0A5M3WLC4_9ACTN|nr:thiamine pyrophosphate-binding protein [Acrocarpospora macrocephala]GES07088.1 acetolactate synthase [Acrocarpospora macrocephala]
MTLFAGSGAEILCEALHRCGASTLFGVPGDTGVTFYDALARRADLTHVLMNDERGAVFAADAYARRLNRPGVVEVSSGGGATFAVGGLGESYAASVPLVVISSDIHRGSRGTGALTETDQVALFSGVTKAQRLVERAADIPAALTDAFEEAVRGRPGPVAVIVPEDVLDETARVAVPERAVTAPHPGPDAATLVPIARVIDGAERPVIVAGGGVHLAAAHAALSALAGRAGIAVATSIHGKGAIDETDPMSLGVVGANGGRDYATGFVADADVVLLVGTRANATNTDSFRAPPRTGAVVIYVDVESPGRAGRNYPGATGLTGDAREVLTALDRLVQANPARHARIAGWVAQERAEWDRAADKRPDPSPALDPLRVIQRVHAMVPDGATVVADCGTPTPYLAAAWTQSSAGRRLLLPRGHGPMGYAHPGGVGAAYAEAERPEAGNTAVPVIVFTTDGSMLMAAGALESAARSGLPIIYVQFSNGSLGWIKALQAFYHEERFFQTQLSAYDAVAVAGGFGVPARRARDLDEFAELFAEAMASGGPCFIDVPVPDEHDCLPPVSSWHRAVTGTETARPVY